jgi:plastocyanin
MVVTVEGVKGAMSFSPDPLTVRVGQAIVWKNGDTIVHQVVEDTSDASAGGGYGYGGGMGSATGFSTDQLTPGTVSSAITFRATGVFSYHCAIHPSMTGAITVTN